MPKIERRSTTVTLYGGQREQKLQDLLDQVAAAVRQEETSQRRMGTRTKSSALAAEYDAEVAAARSEGVDVTVWALSYLHWGPLADEHPPREGNKVDIQRGVNVKTFPLQLALAGLVSPEGSKGLEIADLVARGQAVFDDLGDLSRIHVSKLERAAWDVNVGDDALPKSSLVSLLREQRERDSKPQPDSE